MPSGRYAGTILLADISGYTTFLSDVEVAHRADAFADGRIPAAYGLLSSLLEGIAAKVEPTFIVLKFEGDAVFAVAPDGSAPRGEALIECVKNCYADFVERLAAAEEVWTCTCDACSAKQTLNLKFILHHGEFFIQKVGRQIEAVGPEVNVAHRLLKNNAVGLVGSSAYGLFTDEIAAAQQIPLENADRLVETVDGGRLVNARVIRLGEEVSRAETVS